MTWTQYGSFGAVGCSSDQHTIRFEGSTTPSVSEVELEPEPESQFESASGSQPSSDPVVGEQQGSTAKSVVASVPTFLWPSLEAAQRKSMTDRVFLRALRPGHRYYTEDGLRAVMEPGVSLVRPSCCPACCT